ncbi:cobyrinate a,c-diamide synthase [Vallitalea pronyensis]|uniref:Cobyrinate a,c-diamide synthase n=1 Tax=Vallitalea pronyensis TaxID=1348613 RepID=A0A8J8MHZ6_9FIRM|nr:cobyrinate a,c-diamide synthase [Vallitalea pronyensis]QUI21787.1 cobyrinate a,c-diamide synthase [Vallitalea pronyensis]
MKKIMIAGTKSGVGKTTLTMGILAALAKRMHVQPYKVGPDYIDPAFHTQITGRFCRNLDSYILEEEVIKYLFQQSSNNADIAVIEGVMGLFDGKEVGSDVGTSASIAKLLKTPVILVVDGSKVASSIAATVKGFAAFDKDVTIAGVILNNVGSAAHYELLRDAIMYHTDVIPCGYLIKNADVSLPERHLGLVPHLEMSGLDKVYHQLATAIEATIDLDKILEIGTMAEACVTRYEPPVYEGSNVRVAIAKDKAFHFYYQDSLDYLRDKLNVELVPFSPLEDKQLPEGIHGLILGGGFPEMFAEDLSKNIPMLEAIYHALDKGLPYVAECGGLMYLCDELVDLEGTQHNMVGWLKGYTTMEKRLQRFGYGKLTLKDSCIYGQAGDHIRIHEFHRSKAYIGEPQVYAVEKSRLGQTIRQWTCGYAKKNGVAAYAHLHYYSNLNFAKHFIETCRQYKEGGYSHGIH